MTISYQQAIKELCEMFPDVDQEVIILVLKENKGHMEKTIDSLFVIKGEKPINEVGSTPGGEQSAKSVEQQMALDEQLAREMQEAMAISELSQRDYLEEYFYGGQKPAKPVRREGTGRPAIRPPGPPKDEDEEYPRSEYDEPEEDLIDEMKEKFAKLSESAKLKLRGLWAKMKQSRNTTTGGDAGQSLLKNADTKDEDETEVAFDSSLAKRTNKATLEFGEDDIPLQVRRKPEASTAAAAASTTAPQTDSKKDK